MKKIIGIFVLGMFIFPLNIIASDDTWEIDDSFGIDDDDDAPIVMKV